MAGINIEPNAATVAGPDPDIAAKKHDTTTATEMRPLLVCPTHTCANLTKRLEIPAYSIITPDNIKKGIANSANLPIDEYITAGNILTGKSPTNSPRKVDIPNETAIGTFKKTSIKNDPNNNNANIISPLFFFFT